MYQPYKPKKYTLLEIMRSNGLSDRKYREMVREIRYREEQDYLRKLRKEQNV